MVDFSSLDASSIGQPVRGTHRQLVAGTHSGTRTDPDLRTQNNRHPAGVNVERQLDAGPPD
jgi:hypothetical protein